MKKLLCLGAYLLVLAVGGADRGVWREYVVLAWDYPDVTNQIMPGVWFDPLMQFNLYVHTNVATPLTNWMLLTNVPGVLRSAKIQIAPGSYFFALTASNWWGESDFSNVAPIAGPPRSDGRLFLDYKLEVVP